MCWRQLVFLKCYPHTELYNLRLIKNIPRQELIIPAISVVIREDFRIYLRGTQCIFAGPGLTSGA
jgi:hypothetical protein